MLDRLQMLDRLKMVRDVSAMLNTEESVLRILELTAAEVSLMFYIPVQTLASWRRKWYYDKRYPRFHKRFTGKVYYLLGEIIEDMEKMNVQLEGMAI